jgi:hypothetical protein
MSKSDDRIDDAEVASGRRAAAVDVAGDSTKKQPRESGYHRRLRKKRVYQQSYRDERRGQPDKRRIAVALLEVVLKFEAMQPTRIYDKLFEAVVTKLAPYYEPDVTRPTTDAMRDAAYDKEEEEKSRRRAHETE